MLRVAVPNKGSLADAASAMLTEAGYRQRRNAKDLVSVDADNEVEFFYLRPRDIAVYVGGGTLDLGITGRDLLVESQANATEDTALGFASSTFRFAAPAGSMSSTADLHGTRIATSYGNIVEEFLAGRGIDATVVRLDGAVESAIQLGVADAIADVVETGTTLEQVGLEVFGEPLLSSEGVLIRRDSRSDSRSDSCSDNCRDNERDDNGQAGFAVFKRRLESVMVARNYVMMDYDIQSERVDDAVSLTPGIESPTVSPLRREGWVAVRSMVPQASAHRVMDDLWELGAKGILVTEISACRM